MVIQVWFIKNDTRKYKIVTVNSEDEIMETINRMENEGYTYSGMKETIRENM